MSATSPVVVITGASSGIGRATALRFAGRRARLVLASRRADALEEVAALCRDAGAEAVVVPTDVSDDTAVSALAATAVTQFGRIDVWVNDAAVTAFAPFLDMPLKSFERILDVNVMGYVHGARAALRQFRKQGSGVLINVASVVAEIPQPYTSAYGMSKSAIRALSVSLQQELHLEKLKDIHVVTIAPATVDTPIFRQAANYSGRAVQAMPPVYDVDLIAKAIVDAARRPQREVIVGAQAKTIAKQHGRTPQAIEKQMAKQVDSSHLLKGKAAARTDGNLFEPFPVTDASATGGWSGKARTTGRLLLVTLIGLGGSALLLNLLRRAS